MFDVLPLPYLIQFNTLFSAPFYQGGNSTSLPAGSFPSGAFAFVNSPDTFRQAYFDPNPHRNYVMQWNLTIQRELGKDLSAMVGYVGSRGVHQPFRVEAGDQLHLGTRHTEMGVRYGSVGARGMANRRGSRGQHGSAFHSRYWRRRAWNEEYRSEHRRSEPDCWSRLQDAGEFR